MAHSINSRTVSCPTALVERLLPSESFVVASGTGARPHDSGAGAGGSASTAAGASASYSAPSCSDDASAGVGTRSSSAFLLFSCAVGSGLLTVPSAFVAGGLLGGSLLLLLFIAIEVATLLWPLSCAYACAVHVPCICCACTCACVPRSCPCTDLATTLP